MDYSAPSPLLTTTERNAARRLLVEGAGLTVEEPYDDLLSGFRRRRLVACGARGERVLRMLAVHDEHRGQGPLAAGS
jgi:hypothetical protein